MNCKAAKRTEFMGLKYMYIHISFIAAKLILKSLNLFTIIGHLNHFNINLAIRNSYFICIQNKIVIKHGLKCSERFTEMVSVSRPF